MLLACRWWATAAVMRTRWQGGPSQLWHTLPYCAPAHLVAAPLLASQLLLQALLRLTGGCRLGFCLRSRHLVQLCPLLGGSQLLAHSGDIAGRLVRLHVCRSVVAVCEHMRGLHVAIGQTLPLLLACLPAVLLPTQASA